MNSGAVQAGLMPFRNALINGDMRINQRGTSTNLASLTGVATASPGSWVTDRWNVLRGGFAAGSVIGQGTNLTNADLPFSEAGIKTFGRIGRLSGNTATNSVALNYNMESQDCYQYVGKVVTLSFYYRTGTNFSGSVLPTYIVTGTGTDQALRNGYTGPITQLTTNIVSSTWRRVSFTVTLSSSLNQIGVGIEYTPVGTAGANDYFDITGIQLEMGSVPTSFEVRPFPAELQTCMRYYERSSDPSSSHVMTNFYDPHSIQSYSKSALYFDFAAKYKVTKRTANHTLNLYTDTTTPADNKAWCESPGIIAAVLVMTLSYKLLSINGWSLRLSANAAGVTYNAAFTSGSGNAFGAVNFEAIAEL